MLERKYCTCFTENIIRSFGVLAASMYYMKYLTPKYFNMNSIMTELILHMNQVLKADIKMIFTEPLETAYGK